MHVNKKKATSAQKQRLRTALSAVRNFVSTGIGLRPVVPVSVRTDCVGKTLVYNLTLDRDNVYYANGILVSNCADALALTFALPELPRKPREFYTETNPLPLPGGSQKFQGDYDPFDHI